MGICYDISFHIEKCRDNFKESLIKQINHIFLATSLAWYEVDM